MQGIYRIYIEYTRNLPTGNVRGISRECKNYALKNRVAKLEGVQEQCRENNLVRKY